MYDNNSLLGPTDTLPGKAAPGVFGAISMELASLNVSYLFGDAFALSRLLFESQDMSREQATPKPGRTTQVVTWKRYADFDIIKCILEEAADMQSSHPLSTRRQARLKTILDGCVSVLADLQYIVQKYQSLGTDEKSSWDRLRLGNEDIAEIRSRLVCNITLLTAFRRFALWPTYSLTSLTD